MSATEPRPERTLAVLLGAGWYAQAPKLAHGPSFENSARDLREYLLRPTGLGLPRANINWLFDDGRSSVDQLRDVGDWLERRQQQLQAADTPAADLILYYVGHGMFCGPDRAYHVAIRATEESRESLTSIPVRELARALNDHARFLRKFLVLDCCFAGAAYHEFLSGPLEASRTQLVNELPSRGTALLCAASAKEAAIAPRGLARTMFSDSLLKSLEAGHPGLGTLMSLSDLGALVRRHLRDAFPDNWVRPEIHCPDQREGEVAAVGLFPNPSAAEPADLEEDKRRKADEDRKKAEENRREEEVRLAKEREELERIHKAEQERQAAAIRKVEEERKAELARLRLAARQAEQKSRAAEEAARKAQEQARAAELARQEEQAKREALERLDAKRREAEAEWHRADEAARKAQDPNAGETKRTRRVGETFRDGHDCPEMVVLGPGQFQMFQMGYGPVHNVNIGYTFAVGKYPVTWGEWRRFVKTTKRQGDSRALELSKDTTISDAHPVYEVKWQDAWDYAAWMRQSSGHNYRLLSEAEYEYACRAGSRSDYFWGNTPDEMHLYTQLRSASHQLTGTWPVGRFKANAFGLHDMVGLVWCWVQDRYHRYHKGYVGAPSDGSARSSGSTAERVVRGGSWYSSPLGLRSAYRNRFDGDGSYDYVGFRLARAF